MPTRRFEYSTPTIRATPRAAGTSSPARSRRSRRSRSRAGGAWTLALRPVVSPMCYYARAPWRWSPSTPDAIGGPVDLTVADLSFISLTVVLPALIACTADDGDLLPLVKPQFEVGRERLGAGGVVRDPALRAAAVANVAGAAARLGWSMHGVTSSRLPGPSGNVEFFLWLRRASGPVNDAGARAAIERAAAATAGLQDGPGEATARRT